MGDLTRSPLHGSGIQVPTGKLPPVLVAPEGPAEDVRNALSVLVCAQQLSAAEQVILSRADFAAVCARLWSCVEKLERKARG